MTVYGLLFRIQNELYRFLNIQEIKDLQMNREVSGSEMVCHVTGSMEHAEQILLTQLSAHNILPLKLRFWNRHWKNMFMEVVG